MKDEYVKELIGYSINLSVSEIDSWKQQLLENRPITPEVIGYLLGRSKETFNNVNCAFCNKPILKKEEHTPDGWKVSMGKDTDKPCHESCFAEKLKQQQEQHP